LLFCSILSIALMDIILSELGFFSEKIAIVIFFVITLRKFGMKIALDILTMNRNKLKRDIKENLGGVRKFMQGMRDLVYMYIVVCGCMQKHKCRKAREDRLTI
jgi:hypothetical protein